MVPFCVGSCLLQDPQRLSLSLQDRGRIKDIDEFGKPKGDSYRVENLKMVVLWNFWPGRRTVEGKCSLLGESGKCCVSRQKP